MGGGDRVSAAWKWSMQESSISRYLGTVDYWQIVLVAWCLMLFQGVSVLLYARPLSGSDNEDLVRGGRVPRTYRLCVIRQGYPTLASECVPQGSALQTMAEVTRMSSVTSENGRYDEARAPRSVINELPSMVTRLVVRLWVFRILETGIMLNVQSSGLGLARAVDVQHRIDWQTFISLAIGNIVGVYNFMREVKLALVYHRMVGALHALEASVVQGREQVQVTGDRRQKEVMNVQYSKIEAQIESARRTSKWAFPFFTVSCVAYIALLVRAGVQTVAALVCSHGLHNTFGGCVPIPDALITG